MASVTAEHHIVRTERFTNPNRNCFLADRKMHRTFYFVGWINRGNFLFDPPNPV
jgi:hypothetical protein